jgi:hypothetical protein
MKTYNFTFLALLTSGLYGMDGKEEFKAVANLSLETSSGVITVPESDGLEQIRLYSALAGLYQQCSKDTPLGEHRKLLSKMINLKTEIESKPRIEELGALYREIYCILYVTQEWCKLKESYAKLDLTLYKKQSHLERR